MQQRSEETRNTILAVSGQLFAQYGYEATGVAEICAHSGVSKGAFYYHFPSKQAVFLKLLENWISQVEDGFNIIQQQSSNVPQALMQMADNIQRIATETDFQFSLLLEFWTQANRDQEIWRLAIAPYLKFQEYFTNLITNGIVEKSLKKIDPNLGASVLISLALGLLLKRILNPGATDLGAEISKSVILLLNGLSRNEI